MEEEAEEDAEDVEVDVEVDVVVEVEVSIWVPHQQVRVIHAAFDFVCSANFPALTFFPNCVFFCLLCILIQFFQLSHSVSFCMPVKMK